MPIEIKELHIKVSVSSPVVDSTSFSVPINGKSKFSEIDKQQLIAECLEQILQILNEKRER